MKSGLISENDIQRKVNRVRAMLGRWSPSSPSQALVSSAASFIRYNYITGVEKIILDNIDLAQVAHASSLADVNVSYDVFINNVSGNIARIISRVKCECLWISEMKLSSEDTAALVLNMQNNVEEVRLGGNGRRSGFVELDWDSLLSYDGRGRCRVVECSGQTRKRYGHKLEILGKTMGWSVEKGSLYVLIKRK